MFRNHLTIVLGSAGRRNYLVDWFREALAVSTESFDLVVTEHDRHAPSIVAADGWISMPRFADSGYRSAMINLAKELQPDLFFSLNDYELSVLSDGLADDMRTVGARVLSLGRGSHRVVADKLQTSLALAAVGIDVPLTLTGSDAITRSSETWGSARLIVKHRFGSGSSGVQTCFPEDLLEVVKWSARTARDANGAIAKGDLSLVAVQEAIEGPEFGVDGVFSLDDAGSLEGVLARRKHSMRAGETDRATSEAPDPFRSIVHDIGLLLKPQGLIDMDFIIDRTGRPYVIDINPRFGGGYPFNHVAGADVPRWYVASILGAPDRASLLQYEVGVTSSKYDQVVITGSKAPVFGNLARPSFK